MRFAASSKFNHKMLTHQRLLVRVVWLLSFSSLDGVSIYIYIYIFLGEGMCVKIGFESIKLWTYLFVIFFGLNFCMLLVAGIYIDIAGL